jgi:hypothetical protein
MANPLRSMNNNDTRLTNFAERANPAPDAELEELMLAYPWLASLEPYCIEWELVWFM